MFSALPKPEVDVEITTEMFDSFDDLVIEGFSGNTEILMLQNEIKADLTTIQELQDLYASVESHGLTLPLLHFINASGQLSASIPEIPAVESLTEESPQVDRDAALEGIARTIADVLKGLINKIKEFGSKFISGIKLQFRSLGEVEKLLEKFKSSTAGKGLTGEFLSSNQFKLVSYQYLIELIDANEAVCKFAFAMMKVKIPETRDEKEAYLNTFKTTYQQCFNGIKIAETGRVLIPHDQKRTYTEAGYTPASFGELITHLQNYVTYEHQYIDHFCSEWEAWENEIVQRLSELTEATSSKGRVTKTDPATGKPIYEDEVVTTTNLSEGAKIIDYVYRRVADRHWADSEASWLHGVRPSLRILRALSGGHE
jgi:hypothetical protein